MKELMCVLTLCMRNTTNTVAEIKTVKKLVNELIMNKLMK